MHEHHPIMSTITCFELQPLTILILWHWSLLLSQQVMISKPWDYHLCQSEHGSNYCIGLISSQLCNFSLLNHYFLLLLSINCYLFLWEQKIMIGFFIEVTDWFVYSLQVDSIWVSSQIFPTNCQNSSFTSLSVGSK